MQHPASAPTLGISAPMTANTPMDRAGANTFMPILPKLRAISSLDGTEDSPVLTRRKMAGTTMSTMIAPLTAGGSHRPKASTTPINVQNTKVPYLARFVLSRRLRTPVYTTMMPMTK